MEWDYQFEEWKEDWAASLAASVAIPEENFPAHLETLFRSRYTNPDEAAWKHNRIAAAYWYIVSNADSLENVNWLLKSSKGMDIFPQLSIALYRFFSIAADAALANPPPIGAMIQVVEEQHRATSGA